MTITGSGLSPQNIKGPVRKMITYTGNSSEPGRGGFEADIFTVTGEVIVVVLIPYCTTPLGVSAGAPTLELGVNNDPNLFVAATLATEIDANDFWFDATPIEVGGMAIPAGLKDIAITNNISCLTGTADHINSGVIEYTVYWLPISPDGNVAAV